MMEYSATMHLIIEKLFHQCFYRSYNTILRGGGDEPFYEAAKQGKGGVIYYRADYPSSALHEIAHWCVAGADRRHLDDYGYWYEPDGRTAAQQRVFERVEVKPQAMEWLFSEALGVQFTLSADNLAEDFVINPQFGVHVYEQACTYLSGALPDRAQSFFTACQEYGTTVSSLEPEFNTAQKGNTTSDTSPELI